MNEEDILERLKMLRNQAPEGMTIEDLLEKAMVREREIQEGTKPNTKEHMMSTRKKSKTN